MRHTGARQNVSRLHLVAIAALSITASLSSIANGFALDDVHIILGNERVHTIGNLFGMFGETYWPPEHGASLYRPLTMILFALQWAIGGGSPMVFHAVSIVLYAALSVAVLRFAREIVEERAALFAAALFAVHPLHVEAFANVVGQAELWVALIVIVSMTIFLRSRQEGSLSTQTVIALSALYGAALMFKEHAIVLPALILAAVILLPTKPGAGATSRIRAVIPLLASMSIVAIAFVALRTAVIGRFAGGSTATVFLGQSFSTRLYTMLNVVPEWFRLFLWPANLSADYSPPRIQPAETFDASMIPVVIVVAAAMAIAVRVRRERPAVTYAFAFTVLTLLIPSNLLIVTGFVLAERALLLPSVGVVLLLGYALHLLMVRTRGHLPRRVLQAAALLLVAGGAGKSFLRSVVWKDNETLFRQTVADVPSSYRAHLMLGELLTDAGNQAEGLRELAAAVRLAGEGDAFVRWFAADRFHAAGVLPVARQYYEEAVALKPADQKARYGLAVCLRSLGDTAASRAAAVEGLRRDPADPRFARLVGLIDGGESTAVEGANPAGS